MEQQWRITKAKAILGVRRAEFHNIGVSLNPGHHLMIPHIPSVRDPSRF